MSRRLAVVLEGALVGTLEMLSTGALVFTYDQAHLDRRGATPLSVSMPVTEQRWSGRVVRNWLSNLLPDNDRVLDRWAAQFNVSASSPFRLLEHVGRDVAGAVQFVEPDQLEELAAGDVEWLNARQLAGRLAELRADPAAWTPQMAAGLFSLSGAQAKVALRYDPEADRWGLPHGAEPTTHILKPYGQDLPHQALNEHLSLRLAREVGLNAATSRILTIDGQAVLCVERYDRFRTDAGVLRVHQEDMCQALGRPPSRKYESDGGPGIVDIVALLRRIQGPTRSQDDVNRFLRAQAFAWGTAATDAHAKNYGLLLSGSQSALAPLYDLHSAAPYFTGDRRNVARGEVSVHRAGLAMRVGKVRVFDHVDTAAWQLLADDLRLPDQDLLDLVRRVVEQIPDAVARAAVADEGHTYSEAEQAFVDCYRSAVETRARNALAALDGRGPRPRTRRAPHGRATSR